MKRWRVEKQITKIRDEKGITTNTDKIHRIVITHFKTLYSTTKVEMKFLDIHDLPKISQDETNNLNRSTTPSEVEAINKILTSKPQTNQRTNKQKTQGQIDSVQNSTRLSTNTSLHNIDTERTLINYFMKLLLS